MGRIKTQLIKRTGEELMTKYPGLFTADFDQNQEKITQVAEIPSKRMKNGIAGYLVRLAKRQKDQ